MAADSTPPTPAPLKEWFNAARYRTLARALARLAPGFNRRRFLDLTLGGLEERELMDRLRQTAIALEAALPGTYREKLAIVRALAPRVKHNFVAIALCDFVARNGLDDFEVSLEALQDLTPYGSAEFAVRPFLAQDQVRTLRVMLRWARDPNEHVRRLASEGARPRLPWGQRLPALVRDPEPLAPILETLKDDPSLYVRKSVANHLNDITKDHPEWVLQRLATWDGTSESIAWITRRALRTLIKRGDPRALAFLGAGTVASVRATLRAQPSRLNLGDTLELTAALISTGSTTQRLVVDYVVHYPRDHDRVATKVFKWTELDLPAGAETTLAKRQVIRDFSTRRHCDGEHRVELQINGQRVAATSFFLCCKPRRAAAR